MASEIIGLTLYVQITRLEWGWHLQMDRREHDTEGYGCWCGPSYFTPCDECETGCWKCERGRIAFSREEAESADAPIVVVHNGVDLKT